MTTALPDEPWLLEDKSLLNNGKYKKFLADITSCLARFEKSQDWADLIEKINRLQNALLDYTQFTILPERVHLARTLARCLNPNLVVGIHRKAMETLEIIYKRLGPQQLAKDLPLFSFGLFTLFPHAAISTKPEIMRLYETYFVPLGPEALQTCLGGLLSSVLPTVHKEEDAEIYRRAVTFLNTLYHIFSLVGNGKHFYHTLWSCILTSPSLRTQAFGYLKERLPRSKTASQAANVSQRHMSEITEEMLGGDAPLVSLALQASLLDPVESTQRGALDCLTTSFALHEDGVFSQQDYVALMSCSLALLVQNQLSTLRRVFMWIYGGDEIRASYFTNHSLEVMRFALCDLLDGVGPVYATKTMSVEVLLIVLQRPKTESHFTSLIPLVVPRLLGVVVELGTPQNLRFALRIIEVVPLRYFFEGIVEMLRNFRDAVQNVSLQRLGTLLSFLEFLNRSADISRHDVQDIDLYCAVLRDVSLLLTGFVSEYDGMDSSQFLQYATKSTDIFCVVYGFVRVMMNSKWKEANNNPTSGGVSNAATMTTTTTVTITSQFQTFVEAMLQTCFHQNVDEVAMYIGTHDGLGKKDIAPEEEGSGAFLTQQVRVLVTSIHMLSVLLQHTDLEGHLTSKPSTPLPSPRSALRPAGTTARNSLPTMTLSEEEWEAVGRSLPRWCVQLVGVVMFAPSAYLCVRAAECLLDILLDKRPGGASLDGHVQHYFLFRSQTCAMVARKLWNLLDRPSNDATLQSAIAGQMVRFFSEPGPGGDVGPTSPFGTLLRSIVLDDVTGSRDGCVRFVSFWNALANLPPTAVDDANGVLGSAVLVMIGHAQGGGALSRQALLARNWLQHRCVHHPFHILDFLLRLLTKKDEDAMRAVVVLDAIATVLNESGVKNLLDVLPSPDALAAVLLLSSRPTSHRSVPLPEISSLSYFAALVTIYSKLIDTELDTAVEETQVCVRCVALLRILLTKAIQIPTRQKEISQVCCPFYEPLLTFLSAAISKRFVVLQVDLGRLVVLYLQHLHRCVTAQEASLGPWTIVDGDGEASNQSSFTDVLYNAVTHPKLISVLCEGITVAASLEAMQDGWGCYELPNFWQSFAIDLLYISRIHIATLTREVLNVYAAILEDNRKSIDMNYVMETSGAPNVISTNLFELCTAAVLEVLQYLFGDKTAALSVYCATNTATSSSNVMANVPIHLPMIMRPSTPATSLTASSDAPLVTAQNLWHNEFGPRILKCLLEWYSAASRLVFMRKQRVGIALPTTAAMDDSPMVTFQTTKSCLERALLPLLDFAVTQHGPKFFVLFFHVWGSRHGKLGIELFGEDEADRDIIHLINGLPLTPDVVLDRAIDVLHSIQPPAERKVVPSFFLPSSAGRKKVPNSTSDLSEVVPLHFLCVFLEHCSMVERVVDALEKFISSLSEMSERVREAQYHPYFAILLLRVAEVAVRRCATQEGSAASKATLVDDKKLRRVVTDLVCNVVVYVVRDSELALIAGGPIDPSSASSSEDVYATSLVLLDDVLLQCSRSANNNNNNLFFRDPSDRIATMIHSVFQNPLSKLFRIRCENDHQVGGYVPTLQLRAKLMGRIRAATVLLFTLLTQLFHTTSLVGGGVGGQNNTMSVVARRLGKDVFDLIYDGQFFKVDRATLSWWRDILRLVVSQDASHVEQLVASMKVPDRTANFLQTSSAKRVEAFARARSLKRLAFLLMGLTLKDGSLMNSLLQKLTESIKHYSTYPDVLRYAFLAFRVLIAKAPPHSLTPFWPMMISELIKVLTMLEGVVPSTNSTDIPSLPPSGSFSGLPGVAHRDLVYEALKVIDFAAFLVPEEFQTFRWIFIPGSLGSTSAAGQPSGEDPHRPSSSKASFEPVLLRLQRLFPTPQPQSTRYSQVMELGFDDDVPTSSNGDGGADSTAISEWSARLHSSSSCDLGKRTIATHGEGGGGRRVNRPRSRPCLSLPERVYDSVTDLGSVVHALLEVTMQDGASLITRGREEDRIMAEPTTFDRPYVDWLLLGDFIQRGMFVREEEEEGTMAHTVDSGEVEVGVDVTPKSHNSSPNDTQEEVAPPPAVAEETSVSPSSSPPQDVVKVGSKGSFLDPFRLPRF